MRSSPRVCTLVLFIVYSKQHCLLTKKYDVAHVVIGMYIATKFYGFITLGAHAQQGYGSWVGLSVCLCVCYSISHFSSVCSSEDVTYQGQKFRTVFSETAPLQS